MGAGVDDALWSAIANPSPGQVIDLLVAGGDTTASALAEEGALHPRQAVTKHLVVLEQAGLVTRRKEGRRGALRG